MTIGKTRITLLLALTALIGLTIARLALAAEQAPSAAHGTNVVQPAVEESEAANITRLDGIQAMARFPEQPEALIAGVESTDPVRHSTYISRDGGRHWQLLSASLPSRITVLAVAASDGQTLYAGTEAMGVLKSTDGGRTWTPSSQGLGAMPNATVTSLEVNGPNPAVLRATIGYYLGTSQVYFAPDGSWVSTDGGATWAQAGASE